MWTAVSPSVAFLFLASAMIIAVPLILASGRTRPSPPDTENPAHQSG
jgi:hypothetical protein